MPVSERFREYGQRVENELRSHGFRVSGDYRPEKIGYKIREAQLQKIPYMLVVGDREAAEGTVSVRERSGGDKGATTIAAFLTTASEEIESKGRPPAAAA